MRADRPNRGNNRNLESAIQALRRLPPESQGLVASLIGQLAEAKGVSVATEYKAPAESIGAWVTKLRSERRSERTIGLYEYLARQILERMPKPTWAEVISWRWSYSKRKVKVTINTPVVMS